MARLMKDGRPYRQHLEQAVQASAWMSEPQARQLAAELAGPPFPEAGAQVWTWFGELLEARAWSATGPQPIGYQEIAAWAALTRQQPTAAEVQLLRALDRTWLEKLPEAGGG